MDRLELKVGMRVQAGLKGAGLDIVTGFWTPATITAIDETHARVTVRPDVAIGDKDLYEVDALSIRPLPGDDG